MSTKETNENENYFSKLYDKDYIKTELLLIPKKLQLNNIKIRTRE